MNWGRPPYLTRARFRRTLALLAVALGAVVLGGAMVGPVHIKLGAALFGAARDNVDAAILFRARLPRVLLAAVVGGGLAAAGAALQALLRNPLAEPHIMGVSGGAALGGVLALAAGGTSGASRASLAPLGAFVGALAATALIYRLGSVRGRVQPYVLLLAGVVCNAFAGALIMFVNSIADVFQVQGILFWLMGSLATQSYTVVLAVAAYMSTGVVVLLFESGRFNALVLGEEGAAQLGVDVQRTRRVTFFASSLLVGAAVSVSGMIGFVGLIVPHMVRLVLGADYRLLVPASVLVGAIFLVAADTVARTALGPTEIPVGVVTALCGAPFFLHLLHREGGRGLG